MILLMRDFDQNHRHRQRMLLAAALIGLGLLFVTFLTAGGQARADTTDGMTATDTAPSQAGLDKEDGEALAEASAYLSSLEDMQGDFLQVGPDGSVAEGKFYLRRPGRLRFEYEPPENLLVVADGTWVAVKDSSAPAQRYPIASTPLSLLLAENVNLSESARVLNVETQPGALLVTLADSKGEAAGPDHADFRSAPHAAPPVGRHRRAGPADDGGPAQCRDRHPGRQRALRAARQPAPPDRSPLGSNWRRVLASIILDTEAFPPRALP